MSGLIAVATRVFGAYRFCDCKGGALIAPIVPTNPAATSRQSAIGRYSED